ncbi:5-carboxymethyl-2-hydroxymuconate Delta-isomerase [Noviherbaspirillum sp. CPCC 100848]|uniref:5-carboxymethyl-2-hydroxymuconate Delta-isomerase n=1 Tax=Noviherbaspirillum album TaxID=3080276 RepID=A0ABU6J334_9BURK|nr:5-carboxymethyl-2-hydroxymuconate Delta-isomerase [Noviherbaspirillum sp. CPCC 100848]MEC4717717.1 5-carboxymethyl-2-hydroxymuconate Delta-isomerase [Noviherbaspirillum sp. CPCC 100848]
MPHLFVEYSENLAQFDAAACLATANAELVASGHFEEVDIKSRACCVAAFRVGSAPAGRAFVAARLSILSGRSPEAKQDLSQRVLKALQQHLPSGTGLNTQLSVEVVDIDRSSYAKAVVET